MKDSHSLARFHTVLFITMLLAICLLAQALCGCVLYLCPCDCMFVRVCERIEEPGNEKQIGRCRCLFGCGSVTISSMPFCGSQFTLGHLSLYMWHLWSYFNWTVPCFTSALIGLDIAKSQHTHLKHQCVCGCCTYISLYVSIHLHKCINQYVYLCMFLCVDTVGLKIHR